MKTNNFKSVVKKIKEKKEGFFFSRIESIVDHYWSKWIDIRKNGYDVNIKNPDDIKTEIDFSSLKIPKSFKIENLGEISEYIIIPKNEKFPNEIKVSNLKELSKLIKIEKVSIPKDFSIKNLKDIPKTEFPNNLKKLSLKKTEEILAKLVKQLAKEKPKDSVFIKNKKPEEYIPVRLVDKRGKDWLENFGQSLISFPNKFKMLNIAGDEVNPATSEKQDDIITELEKKADLTETQPVSNASLPLPSGASTEAKQDDTITELQKLVGFEIGEYDYIALTYVAAGDGAGEIETVTYKTGGSGGTTVATLTLAYNASNAITSITKT